MYHMMPRTTIEWPRSLVATVDRGDHREGGGQVRQSWLYYNQCCVHWWRESLGLSKKPKGRKAGPKAGQKLTS
jgi:hypothetical protein